MAIHFFEEDIKFKLSHKNLTKKWLRKIGEQEGFKINELNYIFCSDEYLLGVNLEYLNHDFYTDIITFDNSDNKEILEGDIYISIERVIENAEQSKVNFNEELVRVLSHGIFHLCGYKDKESQDIQSMRNKENQAIREYKEMQNQLFHVKH